MEEVGAAAAADNVMRYWCHVCSQIVSPVMEVEIKCPRCNGGFVEEMEGQGEAQAQAQASSSPGDLSLWAPILLGMLNDGLRRRRRSRSGGAAVNSEHEREEEDNELLASLLGRRQQRASAILEVLNGLQERLQPDNAEREREREQHMILINPFNQAVIIQGGGGGGSGGADFRGFNPIGSSLADYFAGPGLDQLLQHLAENDPNRHGTPPAKKEAVEAMPTVKVEEKTSCYVCLEDFEAGGEAREMPCKHRFHGGCILPWLEAHSSCPVCRYQMPVAEEEEPKESNAGGGGGRNEGNGGNGGDNGGSGRRFWMPVPWPFSGLFSLSFGNGSASSTPTLSESAAGDNSSINSDDS